MREREVRTKTEGDEKGEVERKCESLAVHHLKRTKTRRRTETSVSPRRFKRYEDSSTVTLLLHGHDQ